MIKVCHMTSAHEEEDIRIFRKECVSLAEAGYDVYLVERGESYEKNGVHIVGVGEIPAGRLKRMTQGAKKVYAAAKALDADIYHFHDPELLPYGLKLKKAGKKVIFDSHEMYTAQIREKPYLPIWCAKCIAAVYDRYEQHVLRRIDDEADDVDVFIFIRNAHAADDVLAIFMQDFVQFSRFLAVPYYDTD